MFLRFIDLKNFRNHKDLSFEFQKGITVFTGPNGIGKTSVLEAISILGSAKSFRSARTEDFIQKGSYQSKLSAKIEREDIQDSIQIDIESKKKSIRLNNKSLKKRRQILETLPFVVFSPGDHKIVEAEAAERRSFINRAISNVDFAYADAVNNYQKVLIQRNKLLKQYIGQFHQLNKIQAEIAIWDKQLLEYGSEIVTKRIHYIEKLTPLVQKQYQRMCGREDKIEIDYQINGIASYVSEQQFSADFHENLEKSLQKDIILGRTNIGPHRDEIIFLLNQNKLKSFGSQGEKRTMVLALRLGEVSLFKEVRKIHPILLIDDVSSELDISRRQSLVELLKDGYEQVLITATELPTDLLKDIDHPFVHWDLSH